MKLFERNRRSHGTSTVDPGSSSERPACITTGIAGTTPLLGATPSLIRSGSLEGPTDMHMSATIHFGIWTQLEQRRFG